MAERRSRSAKLDLASNKAAKLRLQEVEYTLILCVDRKTEKCCAAKSMNAAWRQLKRRCKQWRKSGNPPVLRIKSGCIGICHAGPIIGVLPDGVWYGFCTPEVIDRIFDEHLATGDVVREHLIAAKATP